MKDSPTLEQAAFRPNPKLLEASTSETALSSRPGAKNAHLALYGAGLLFLVIFACYVWPTPYETYQGNDKTMRVNRFTGETQDLEATGWVVSAKQLPEALDDDLLRALAVDGTVITRGTLHTRIYNGTSTHLSGVTLLLTVLNKDRTVKLTRPYLARPEDAGDGGAYGDSGFGARCSYALQPGETWRVAVAGASGTITPGLTSVRGTTGDDGLHAASVPDISAAPVKSPVSVAALPSKSSTPPAKPVAPVTVAAAPPPVHSMPLSVGVTPPRPVEPLKSAIAAPRGQSLPSPLPSAVTPTLPVDPAVVAGLTPLQASSLQERYDKFKSEGALADNPTAQAWSLAALARNLVHDDHKPDLTKVPTPVLESSLHMINTYKPADFLRS